MSESIGTEATGESDYKEVMLGPKTVLVPGSWSVEKLGSPNITNKIKAGGTPKATSEEYYGGEIKYVKIEDMSAAGKYIRTTENHLTKEGLESTSTWLVPEDSLLLSMYGSYGKVAITCDEMATNQAILGIIPSNSIDLNYLYYASSRLKPYFESVVLETTQANLNKGIVENTPILIPPLPEQRRIADILSTVDKQIQQTDEMIECHKELKHGLLQDLLTTGIGANVTTKKERMGPMPVEIAEDWDMEYFDDIIELNPNDEVPDDEKFPFLPMDSVNEETQTVDYWEQRDVEDCTRVRFRKGDTVYAKITPCTENGKIAFIEEPDGLAFGSTEFLVFRARENKMLPKYVYYLSNLPQFRAVTISLMEGSTGRQRVPSDTFKQNIRVPVPSKKQQRTIVETLDRVQQQIMQELDTKQALKELKRGLMQDLLTGKVRVNTD